MKWDMTLLFPHLFYYSVDFRIQWRKLDENRVFVDFEIRIMWRIVMTAIMRPFAPLPAVTVRFPWIVRFLGLYALVGRAQIDCVVVHPGLSLIFNPFLFSPLIILIIIFPFIPFHFFHSISILGFQFLFFCVFRHEQSSSIRWLQPCSHAQESVCI